MQSPEEIKRILFGITIHPEDKPLITKYISEILLQPVSDTFGKISSDITIKAIFSGIAGLVGLIVYENSLAIIVLLSFIFIDWITGILAAIKSHNFNSAKFRLTVIKMLIYLLIIGLFHTLEYVNPLIKYAKPDTFAATYLAVTEIISILENITRISNIKLPSWVLKRLRMFQKSGS